MAARTFTSAGVNNLWSNAANWDGGATIPAEDDSVTIPAGQTCEYDYNSAYTTGINGITVTGTLKLTRSAGTYRLFMKAATTIAGAGTFDCGASALDAIPFTAKHTVTGGAGWYINGASGLTMTVYAAEPAIPTIELSGDEAIGQTIWSVGTDITGDIWADGDTIRISDYVAALESEERVIAAGGRAATTLTVTAGLTAAKNNTAAIHLMTRNVQFIQASGSQYICKTFASGKLTIAGGYWNNVAYRCFNACTGMVVSGGAFCAAGAAGQIFDTCASLSISGGVFTNAGNPIFNCNLTTITGGYFTAWNTAVTSTGATINGGTYRCGSNYAINLDGSTVLNCTVNGCNYGVTGNGIIFGGTIAGLTSALTTFAGDVKNATLTGGTNILSSVRNAKLFNVSFGSGVENTGYTSLSKEAYTESIDNDQVAGAFKAWTKGGVTTKQATTYPVGKTYSMQLVLENATNEGFWQREVTVAAGASINITSYLRKSASMTYLPRVIIFNKASTDPFAGGAGIDTFTMTDSVDTWESDTYTYYNSTSEDVVIVIRTQGMNASGNVFSLIEVEQINVDLTTLINNLAVVDANVDSILVDTTLALDVLMNKMITDPTTGIMTLYNDAGVAMLTAQLYEDAAGLQTYRGKGAERRERLT